MANYLNGEVPLFPLHTVLFPGGRLPLQVFEARYVDMVSQCLRDGSPFGVVLIRDGHEVVRERFESPPSLCGIGTLASIADFDAVAPGKLRVVATGDQRFRLTAARQVDNHLLVGRLEMLDDQPVPLEARHQELVDILNTLALHPMIQRLGVDFTAPDCQRLSFLLGQYLPLDETLKQSLLATDDALERLAAITGLVHELQGQEELPRDSEAPEDKKTEI